MNVLITGGCGFVGANLSRLLLKKTRWDVTLFDDFSSGNIDYIKPILNRVNVIEGDVSDYYSIFEATKNKDYVIHLAARAGVIQSIDNPFYDMDVNIKGTLNTLHSCINNNVSHFIFPSSGSVLGNNRPPLYEDMRYDALSPYATSKVAGEMYCNSYSNIYDIKTTVLRFSNIYGKYSNHKTSVIHKYIRQIKRGEPITKFGDGYQTRDFVYVDDVCNAIYLSLKKKQSGLYHIGSGIETSINELIDILEKKFNIITIKRADERDGEMKHNYFDITRAQSILSYQPETKLEEGIDNILEGEND